MPTIIFTLKDLQSLVGKDLSVEEIGELVEFGKGELEKYNKESDEITVNFDDTNLPFLWSVEGVARLFRGVLGLNRGMPSIDIINGAYELIVDPSVKNIRPYVAAFIAKGRKVDGHLLKQMVQLQEKLCESYGLRRKKVAIGIYSYDKITFPVHYKAVDPTSVKFVPLGSKKEMDLQEILGEHPKGKEYAWTLEGMKKYPLLVDAKNEVLSFPPIINSNFTGKVAEGEEHLFFEATGNDETANLLALNIIAFAVHERGFAIHSVTVRDGKKSIETPFMFSETMKITQEQIKHLIGIDLKKQEIACLLGKAGYGVKGDLRVQIPAYRGDILHPVDLAEDVGIMYGYVNVQEIPLSSYTIGQKDSMVAFRDKIREIVVGLGFQEVMSTVLSNKAVLEKSMNIKDSKAVEIENFMSDTYSCVRSWLLPILMDFLSKNKHVEYPQRVFEAGTVSVQEGTTVQDYERVAMVSANEKADYTEMRQVLDYVLSMLTLSYKIVDVDHGSFLPGRVGRVIVEGKDVGYLGEIHPNVLENHGLQVPVVALELNLSELFSRKS